EELALLDVERDVVQRHDIDLALLVNLRELADGDRIRACHKSRKQIVDDRRGRNSLLGAASSRLFSCSPAQRPGVRKHTDPWPTRNLPNGCRPELSRVPPSAFSRWEPLWPWSASSRWPCNCGKRRSRACRSICARGPRTRRIFSRAPSPPRKAARP